MTNHDTLMHHFDSVELVNEAAALDAPASPEGWVWEAEMLRPGLSLNGNTFYTPEFIREAARDFEGCPSYADHQATPAGSIRNVVGTFRNVRAEEANSEQALGNRGETGNAGLSSPFPAPSSLLPVLKGQLHLLRSENWIREKLLAARDTNMPMGLSINAIVGLKRAVRVIEGKQREVMEPQRIIPGTPRSVDLVMFPAAGGRVLRAIANVDLQAALEQARHRFVKTSGSARKFAFASGIAAPAVPEKIQGGNMHDPMHTGTPGAETANGAGAVQESLQPLRQEITSLQARLEEAQQKQRAAEAHLLLNQKLSAARLPEPLARLVRENFRGCTPAAEELDRHIASVREAYAAVVPSPTLPGSRAMVIEEPEDRHQIALDKLFGLRKGPDGREYHASVPAFRGIQEAYICITNDRGLQWEIPAGRLTEDWNAAGFANALGNTLYRRLIQDYQEVDYGLDLLIPPREPHRVSLRDFRTHEIIRVGYLSDLNSVDPEQIDWPEIVAPTDEKATISAVQFGGMVTVTRKTIINDDIGLVAKIASRIGRAARRTMAQRVFNLMITNGNIYDGLAFFEAGTHKNLGSTALDVTELDAIRTAMRNQTEKDSGKKLGIGPWILVVPVELEGAAKITNTRQYVDNNFTPNKVQYMFGNNNERVIVAPLLSDPNDWYVFANPDELQTFEIGFLQGRAEPELLLADNQLVGKAFSSDRIQYKVRHEYEVAVVDFRGAYKEVV